MLGTAPFAIAAWRPPTGNLWLLLIAVGVVAAIGQVLMTHALAAVDAATAGIISQLTVVTAMTLGVVIDGEAFGSLSLLGAALTVAGVAAASGVGGAMRLSYEGRRE